MEHKNNIFNLPAIKILAVIIIVLVSIVSIFGGFVDSTYKRDHPSMAVQAMGQDLVDLFIVIPTMIIVLVYFIRRNTAATLILGGIISYILYSFIIYCFGVYFNYLFLIYCFTLGCSLYLFILYLVNIHKLDVTSWFKDKIPAKAISIYFVLVALMFYFLWLKDLVPAILNREVPESVSGYNLLVNPVHVIDLAIALPALLITSYLLIRGKKLGYILAPVLLVFMILMALALIGMAVMLKVKNVTEDFTLAYVFLALAGVSTFFLFLFLRKLRNANYTEINL
jgi:hypothetical protein